MLLSDLPFQRCHPHEPLFAAARWGWLPWGFGPHSAVGTQSVPLAGRCQAFPSLPRSGRLESYRGFPKSHQLLLWAISEKDKAAFLPRRGSALWGSLRSPEWAGSDLLFDFGVKPQLSNNLVKRLDSGSLLLSQLRWGVPSVPLTPQFLVHCSAPPSIATSSPGVRTID